MDSEPPQASAAPDRLLWFYRALAVRRKAAVFVSAAPAEPDTLDPGLATDGG